MYISIQPRKRDRRLWGGRGGGGERGELTIEFTNELTIELAIELTIELTIEPKIASPETRKNKTITKPYEKYFSVPKIALPEIAKIQNNKRRALRKPSKPKSFKKKVINAENPEKS